MTGAALFPAGGAPGPGHGRAPEGPTSSPSVQRDVGRLEILLRQPGRARYEDRRRRRRRTAENRFAVEFRIVEGRRLRVDRIVVAGSPVTRRRLIDRQIRLQGRRLGRGRGHPGDPSASWSRLGVFSEVRIEEVPTGPETDQPGPQPPRGRAQPGQPGLGTGDQERADDAWTWPSNVIGPRATAEFIRGNVFGRAAQLSLVGQFSEREKRAVVSWEEPFLFGWSVPITINGWLEREARESYGFDRRGVSLSGTRTLASGWTSLTTLRWASTTLYFLEIEENEVDRQHFPFSATSVSETFLLDRRDDSFNPERGYFFSGVLEWAYPLFKAESDYIKIFVKAQVYQPALRHAGTSA